MELDMLSELTKLAGIGGLSLGIVLLLFRRTLSDMFLSKLTKVHSYKVINRLISFTFVIATLGLILWFFESTRLLEMMLKDSKSFQIADPTPKAELDVQHIKYDRINPYNTQWTAEVDIDYVQISGLDNELLQKRINERLKHDVGADVEYEQANWYIDVIRYTIEGDLISVLSEGTYYGHGAGAGNIIVSSNINLKTGGRVFFKDLFIAGYKSRLDSLTKKYLNDQGYGMFFEGLDEDQCYYYNGQYLSLCFDEYEVAPGAAGSVTIDIPVKEIRDLISLNGPLAYAI
ncbi:RsiV family protein [Vibrio kanaloae]|uniref:RsiV family protein n=1 Tax=Vibrio kanaloae TaxID=170673 RepID=UPI0010BD6654|nr:RsiV family protein [Vibrio kanaloae]TKF06313.1 DUF3298 domain-containing protein [Vibrio kanaloae]TKF63759.1 DUF3298 domain-containing protein [Vibrio kanaloae]